ncbi:MAG: MATE family efflux transporter [Pacificimonas sp.]
MSGPVPAQPVQPRLIWAIAIPAMATNVATALIGIGDMWIVGRLEDVAAQGAVDVGAKLFALIFVVMNFLKTGTTGLVAQDRGTADAQAETLVRALLFGLALGGFLLVLKPLIVPFGISALGAAGEVAEQARIYIDIRYWAAPAFFANLALIGLLVGRRQVRAALAIEVCYNLTNVGLGLLLVLVFDFGIAGIGWSSLIAEYAKFTGMALFVMRGETLRNAAAALGRRGALSWAAFRPLLNLNGDLFLRSLILALSMAALTRVGAGYGPVALAANGIIFQLFIFSALLIDGFENAAQVLNGERYGARDRAGFMTVMRAILWRGLGVAALLSGAFAVLGGAVLDSFAATPEVAAFARDYLVWLVLIPVTGVLSFVFDGVFIGASWTRAMLLSMALAAGVYAFSLWLAAPLGNHGLWMSFNLFLLARAGFQALLIPRLAGRSFPASVTDAKGSLR